MTSVDRTNQLLAVLQEQLAKRIAKTGEIAKSQSSQRSEGKPRSKRKELDAIKAEVHEKIKQLDLDDKNYRQKTAAIFVEIILDAHFGEELTQNQGFQDIISQVTSVMLTDSEIRPYFVQLIDELIDPASK